MGVMLADLTHRDAVQQSGFGVLIFKNDLQNQRIWEISAGNPVIPDRQNPTISKIGSA